MLRKLNFTERTKIPRTNVHVSLRRGEDGVLVFDPRVSLDELPVAPSARVFIEAYYRTAFMRFDCGSVSAFTLPDDRRLTEIGTTNVVRFRVKIVDDSNGEHRIVAVADDMIVSEEKPDRGGRLPLLPVNFSDDLGQQPWRISFEPNGPVLELNNRINDVRNVARHDAAFLALVYPAAVREVFTHILLVDHHDGQDEGDEWWSLWLRWAGRYNAPALPVDEDERRLWIDDVVREFCAGQRFVDQWRTAREERS